MPAHDFRRDVKAIAGLAVMLVVLTTICPVAATSAGQRLGLPSRLLTILEGEGLVKDASSLVLLSSAVAATTVTVHLRKVAWTSCMRP